MAEKIIPSVSRNDNGSIVIVLTSEEYEILRNACLELIEFYESGKRRSLKIKRILDKLEEAPGK